MSVLFATTITFNTVHAAENTANQKGTMGYGYQKYIEKHPEEKIMKLKKVPFVLMPVQQLLVNVS